MKDLFDKFRTRIPRYSEEYQFLFDSLTAKGGASAIKQVNLGKHFGNNYELYLYAFFLGVYRGEPLSSAEGIKRNDFSYAIQFWGNRGGVAGRKDYSAIQENIFGAVVAKSEIDLIALEKGDLTEEQAIRIFMKTMEDFTNSGLNIIKEKVEDSPNHFLNPTSFLDLIVNEKTIKQ